MTRTIAIVDGHRPADPSTFRLVASAGYLVFNFADSQAFLGTEPSQPADCVLLDIRVPDVGRLDLLRALAIVRDPPSVLVITDAGDVALAVEAMKLGAADVLERPCPPEKLLEAIEHACMLRERSVRAAEATRRAVTRVTSLPLRLRQVLRGIVMGRANKVIAYELALSIRTVEAYRAQLFVRLGVRSTAEAVGIAMAAGIDRFGADAQPHAELCRRP
jgi:two-component system, LuxR family, response regulator FixJ